MTRLPIVDFKVMEKAPFVSWFSNSARKGIHVFYRHPDGRTTTLPNHSGRNLARPLIREILREIDLTPEQFRDILEKL